ncbi:MAG: RNA polymerase sigma factor [Chloroflexota bacterium]
MEASPARLDEQARRAIEAAYEAHHAGLVRRLAIVVGDPYEAQDLAQATFERALAALDRFDGTDIRGWLYTIGMRLAINERRRRKRLQDFLSRTEPDLSYIQVDPDLWHALQGLDRRTRAAIVLSVLDGYRYQEISAMLDVPAGTIGSWITRGKAQLRSILDEERR